MHHLPERHLLPRDQYLFEPAIGSRQLRHLRARLRPVGGLPGRDLCLPRQYPDLRLLLGIHLRPRFFGVLARPSANVLSKGRDDLPNRARAG